MKTSLVVLLAFVAGLSLRAAIGVGDPLKKVIQEKGAPSGVIEAGDGQVLQYPDATIKLRNKQVVAVEAPAARPASVAPPSASGANRARSSGGDTDRASWSSNYAAALAQARQENRKVFLFFTGSDWCVWCKRLQAEVLSTAEFNRYASEKFVLVELDFPHNKRLAAEVKSQNASLAKKFGIRGYPTVIVLDSAGKKVGELGYQPGGPGPFVKALGKL